MERLLPRSRVERFRAGVVSLLVALLVAVLIRQSWFELYEIPSGSMRPTLKESDLLVVSKTHGGVNVPLRTGHLYFDTDLLQRGAIVTFTSEDMDLDSDVLHFGFIPGKRQLVKRLIGKPGDSLYFYGGKIYGVDADGRELTELRDSEWAQGLEHIPFIRFEGKTVKSGNAYLFHQMNIPIAKLTQSGEGEMLVPQTQFSDLWGFCNFAMARLLTPEQLRLHHAAQAGRLETAPLYLELIHHPALRGSTLAHETSILPMKAEHLDAIARNLNTARFTVKDGAVSRDVRFADVPDGTYEILSGVVYQIHWKGVATAVVADHPLYRKDAAQIQQLYNLGIEFNRLYQPSSRGAPFPSRYAYFREGGLYLLGAQIFEKGDPLLKRFLERELEKRSLNSVYQPFEDLGPPTSAEFIRTYGVTVPDRAYLLLGDNHAMSGDSRQFGFVPEENLRGKVSFIFWPAGDRIGALNQPTAPFLTLPNLIIWGIAAVVGLLSWMYQRRYD